MNAECASTQIWRETIAAIAELEPLATPTAIRERMGLRRSTLHRRLQQLLEWRLVERDGGPRSPVRLTDKGRLALERDEDATNTQRTVDDAESR